MWSVQPSLLVRPGRVQTGDIILVTGSGWPLDAIVVTVGKDVLSPRQILRGSLWKDLLVPHPDGSFLFELPTAGMKMGRHLLRAETAGGVAAEIEIRVDRRVEWGPKVPREQLDKPYLRGAAFMRDRVGAGRGWPNGFTEALRKDWIRKYGDRRAIDPGGGVFYLAPVPGACNWVPLGPAPFTHGKGSVHGSNTGRIRSLAIDPVTPSRMYAGTASAGVWKSIDAGATWLPKSDNHFSLAIGALAVDPNAANVVYAGTGEMVPGSDYGYYYGRGLLRSSTHGESWTEIGTTEFNLAEIARIVVNPADSANLFVAASNGLWESTASGSSWTLLASNPCTDVVLVRNPAEPGTLRLVAGFADIGVRQSANTGSGWSSFADVTVPGAPLDSKRVVFGVCRTQPQTMYAAFATATGGAIAHVARSDDWGTSWAARTIPAAGRLWFGVYNLAILPHPTSPATVLLGVVDVFKSIDGGGTWTEVSYGGGLRVHADVHSISWHPTAPNSVYVTCDGGLFFTPDVCVTWASRNLDVAAIQLYDLSHHPVYEAILIAGSQDNGGFHYSGAPIWRRTWVGPGVSHTEMDGDAVVTQIDPYDPYVHYYGTGPESRMNRSTDGGKFFPHFWTSFPGTEWWIPFSPDPRTAGVVFTGGTQLMRSGDRGTNWTAITGALAARIRAIGFHPTDPLVLYVGTTGGHVYRITGPAAGSWTSTTVTTLNVTYTGLPAGMGISSIAVDPSGNVWVTSSDLMHTEATGEFTSDHVFRLDAGATSWATKSTGLVAANPINTIVIDPANPSRVFCGGDRAVFSWNATTQSWTPLDEGLPNAPVVKLLIHNPSRTLRAATYGRGVWERSLDSGACSDHFLYFRDNLVDSGRTPSPDGVPHPYLSGERCWHWQSEDIIVDSYNQTPSIVTSAIDVYDQIVHLGARRGANRVYVTVHNKGPFAVTNVRVRAYFAAAAAGLPGFPPGLLADPFLFSPGASSTWAAVGPAFSIPRIEPGTTRLAHWQLAIPASASRHSCLLAFATSTDDPFDSGGITNPDLLVVHNRKVTLKNLDLDVMPTPPGSGSGSGSGGSGPYPAGSSGPRMLRMHGDDERGNVCRAVVTCGHLPEDAVIVVAVEKKARRTWRVEDAKLSRHAQKLRDAFARVRDHPRELTSLDLKNLIVRDARAGEAVLVGEAVVTKEKPIDLAVWVHSRKWDPEETYTFDLVQMIGNTVMGGFTVRLTNRPGALPQGLQTL